MLCESGTVSQVTDGYLVSVLAVSILGEEFFVATSVLLQLLCCLLVLSSKMRNPSELFTVVFTNATVRLTPPAEFVT